MSENLEELRSLLVNPVLAGHLSRVLEDLPRTRKEDLPSATVEGAAMREMFRSGAEHFLSEVYRLAKVPGSKPRTMKKLKT